MTKAQILKAVEKLEGMIGYALPLKGDTHVKADEIEQDDRREHLRYMCEEIRTWMDSVIPMEFTTLVTAERLEKSARWLGFVQGAVWSEGWATIDDLRKMNAPEKSAPALTVADKPSFRSSSR